MRTNTVFLDEVKGNKISAYLETKQNVNNAATFYYISNVFKPSNCSTFSLRFVERCFPMVVESNEFLELDFKSVGKILSSSELNIDSELQVFNAADEWLCHNITGRSKYAKYLLLKIRISLLSIPALNYIIRNESCFATSDECVKIMNEVLVNKTKGHRSNKVSSITRYCNQSNFNIIVCGGVNVGRYTSKVVSDVFSIKANNLLNINALPDMKQRRRLHRSVSIKGDLYVFGGRDGNENGIMSVEKYSPATNAWEHVADMFDEQMYDHFCACSFMDNVYVLGEYGCMQFITKNNTWKKIASMQRVRRDASCTSFEGRIVVCGGATGIAYINRVIWNIVEVYDHIADSWTYMPNMIERRWQHRTVAIKNKLFVIGGSLATECEIYDSTCNKFVVLSSPPVFFRKRFQYPYDVISIGSELIVFGQKEEILVYDDINFEWTEKPCAAMYYTTTFYCCVKLPQF